MITKGIWVTLAFAIAITTIMTGTSVDAAKDDVPKGEPFQTIETEIVALQLQSKQVDSFFDVFFRDTSAGFDSFFDIFVDAGEERIVDSFFDIFTELHETDEGLQEQINALRQPTQAAAVDYFLKIPDIPGESTDDGHKDWINLSSVSLSIQGTAGSSTPRIGSVITDGISVSKELDKSTPKLQEAIANGKLFDEVTIDLVRILDSGERVTYYKYELKNVIVSSYSVSGSGQAEDIPVEDVTLNFAEVKVTYTEYDDKGSNKGNVETTWKVEEGES